MFSAIKIAVWFMKNEAAYLELRRRGLKPLESLKWAGEYKWIRLREKQKIMLMSEWDREMKRFPEHPLKMLREEYGYRLTYKEILGLED